MDKVIIFCYANGPGVHTEGVQCVALGSDGNHLFTIECSNELEARQAFGFGTSTSKHYIYDRYYGKNGWSLMWIHDPNTHLKLQSALLKMEESHGHGDTGDLVDPKRHSNDDRIIL